jgi:hypothetical protein
MATTSGAGVLKLIEARSRGNTSVNHEEPDLACTTHPLSVVFDEDSQMMLMPPVEALPPRYAFGLGGPLFF